MIELIVYILAPLYVCRLAFVYTVSDVQFSLIGLSFELKASSLEVTFL